jgi:sugar lactone lactonase YvrE
MRVRRVLAALALVAGAYLLWWPVAIDPVVFSPPPNPGMAGPFAPNDWLRAAEHIADGIGQGPEDITKGPDGFFYTGLQDGRVARFREDGSGIETYANTAGRPLGMHFDARGNLIVADAFRGLLAISPERRITVLADSAGGERLLFPDDLDIAADGTVWFSNASQRFDQHHWILDFLETRATGSLLSYDPRTGKAGVRLSGLMFANGVALGPGEEYVLVNETLAARVTRLWLRGPKTGQKDTFVTLAGYPDNLSFDGMGTFWVAMPARRDAALEKLWEGTLLRKILLRLPFDPNRLAGRQPYSWVAGVDVEGKVVHNLQDAGGGCGGVTSVNRFDRKLWLGSIYTTHVCRVPVL